MKVFPYGGIYTAEDLKDLSKTATANNQRRYLRKMSLMFEDLLADANSALQDLSHSADIVTIRKHMKILSLLLIAVSILGLFLLEINRNVL